MSIRSALFNTGLAMAMLVGLMTLAALVGRLWRAWPLGLPIGFVALLAGYGLWAGEAYPVFVAVYIVTAFVLIVRSRYAPGDRQAANMVISAAVVLVIVTFIGSINGWWGESPGGFAPTDSFPDCPGRPGSQC